ncbi:hypothetical protein BH09PAT2_BH09PAT2_02080 [soil metagenome]
MNTENQYSQAVKNILTIEQLKQNTQLLRETYERLYKKSDNIRDSLEEVLPYFLVENIFDITTKNSIPLTDLKQIQKIITDMKIFLENLPVAEIVISFTPRYKDVTKLSAWWEEYTGEHTILAIQIDESVVAGARISYAGFYKDYSLANWLNQNAARILE